MGTNPWSDDAYRNLRTSYTGKSTDDVFTQNKTRTVLSDMSPVGLGIRESRDSMVHPTSIAIAVFLDVTGSMGYIPEKLVREDLGTLMNILIEHGVGDAHVLFGGIGDTRSDRCPLQVGQFEAGADELAKWLTGLYLEGNGGGQNRESYLLAWLVAGRHTSIDCFEKRGKKGFLFTIGDEANWDHVSADHLKKFLGYTGTEGVTDEQLLIEAQRMYNVFHIHIQEGAYRDSKEVIGYWRDKLKERLIIVEDYTTVPEVIASTVAVMSGADLDTVINSLSNSKALAVRAAVSGAIVENGNTGISQANPGIINLC
jgi:hypothetical protein